MLGGGGVALGTMMAFTSLTVPASTATCSFVSTIVAVAVASDASAAASDADTIVSTNVTAAGDATASDAADAAEVQNVDWLRGQQLRQIQHLSERQLGRNSLACSKLKAGNFVHCNNTE